MLRTSYVFVLLLGAASVASADFPDGVIDERHHDFGVVPRGQQLTHYIRVYNPTKTPLQISGLRVSCGCVTPQALENTIQPGRESAIFVHMDGRRFIGAKTVTIYITFSQPRYEEIRTVVSAFARDDFVFTPDLINLGKVKQGDAKSGAMNITFYNGSIQMLDAKAESVYVIPSFKEIRRTAVETVYQLEAKLRPDTPPGHWFTDIYVQTNGSGLQKLRVPLAVEVVKNDVAQPASEPKSEPKTVPAIKTGRVQETDDVARESPEAAEPRVQDRPYRIYQPAVEAVPTERVNIFPLFRGYFRR